MSLAFDIELDTCGLNCPLPILKAKKSLTAMQSGQVLKVMSTDPGAHAILKPLPSKRAMSCCCNKPMVIASLFG